MVEPYLGMVLSGAKTVESRFSMNKSAPYDQAGAGDVLLWKRSSGPVVGWAVVTRAEFHLLSEATWPEVRQHGRAIGVGPEFWEAMRGKRYASLLFLGPTRPLQPIAVAKLDRRPWAILRGQAKQGSLL